MQAADSAGVAGQGLVVLHEGDIGDLFAEPFRLEGFHEEAA
jgi:hypothetical protein